MTNSKTSDELSGCQLTSLPQRTIVKMTGADRISFLHNLCTNDIRKLQPGNGCEAFITDVRGKTIGHVTAHHSEDALWLCSSPNQATTLLPHFDKYLITEDVQLSDQSENFTELAVWGAESASLLTKAGLPAPTSIHDHADGPAGKLPCVVRRAPIDATPVFFLMTATENEQIIRTKLKEVGATEGNQAVLETLRIEQGWPRFGIDFSAENLPQELNRDAAAISFTKGCYLGQETIARIDALGHVNRLFVGLRFPKDHIPAIGDAIVAEEKEIGHLSSVTHSSLLSTSVGLGFVRSQFATPNSQVQSKGTTCEVVAFPMRAS